MREFYQCIKYTAESTIECGCQFGTNKAWLGAHHDYNALAHNREKLTPELDPLLDKQNWNS